MTAFKTGQCKGIRKSDIMAIQQDGVRLHTVTGGDHEADRVEITDSSRLLRSHAPCAIRRRRHMKRLLIKNRMEQTVLGHMGQPVGIFHLKRNSIKLQISQFISLFHGEMEDNRVLIVKLQAIQTDRHTSLCGDRSVRPAGIMHNIGLMQKGSGKGMIRCYIIKCMGIAAVVGQIERNPIHIYSVNQITGISGDQKLWGGKTLHIHFSRGADGASFTSSHRHNIIIEVKGDTKGIIFPDIGQGKGIGAVVVIGGDTSCRQRHTTNVVAFIGIKAEADSCVPRDNHFAVFTAIRHNPAVFRFRNPYMIGEMSENHINDVVRKNGEDGLGKGGLDCIRAKIIGSAIRIQIADITSRISRQGVGDLIPFLYGCTSIGGCSIGGHTHRTTVIRIDCKRIDDIGGVCTEQDVINKERITLSCSISDSDILCIGRHIALIHQPCVCIEADDRVRQPHKVIG